MTDEELAKYHVYSNKTDWIIGTSLNEAIAVYCLEIGLAPSECYSPAGFVEVPGDSELSVREEDSYRPERRTIREWIRVRLTGNNGGASRLVASTEF
jgi:hypothetical protein